MVDDEQRVRFDGMQLWKVKTGAVDGLPRAQMDAHGRSLSLSALHIRM